LTINYYHLNFINPEHLRHADKERKKGVLLTGELVICIPLESTGISGESSSG